MSGYGGGRRRSPSPDRGGGGRGSGDRWRGGRDERYDHAPPPRGGGYDDGGYGGGGGGGSRWGQEYTRDRRPPPMSDDFARAAAVLDGGDEQQRGGRGPGGGGGGYGGGGYGGGGYGDGTGRVGGGRERSRSRERYPSGRGGDGGRRFDDNRGPAAPPPPPPPRGPPSVNAAPLERAIVDARNSYRDAPSYPGQGQQPLPLPGRPFASAPRADGREGDRPGAQQQQQQQQRAAADDREEGLVVEDVTDASAAGAKSGGATDDGDDDVDEDALIGLTAEQEEERRLAESRARRAAILAKRGVAAPASGAAQPPLPQPVAAPPAAASAPAAAATAPPKAAAPAAAPPAAAPLPPPAAPAAPAAAAAAAKPKPPAARSSALLSMFEEDADDEAYEDEAAVRRPLGGGSAAAAVGDVAGLAAAGSARAGRNAAAVLAASEAAPSHGVAGAGAAAAAATNLSGNWDDPEGYYRPVVGENLDGRYTVLGLRGRGVFSSVLYCRDTQASADAAAAAAAAAGAGGGDDDDAVVAAAAEGRVTTAAAPTAVGTTGAVVRQHAALATGSSQYVAVKVVRANDTMRRAGQKELDILRQLATADPSGRYHCVRLLATFEHRGHLCLVFEPLAMNLKEVQNKFGKGVGLALPAVRAYAKQLLLALALLSKLRLIHADIKPHNVLANERFNVIKLADFGSAFREDDPDNEPTPYLVSRFYRAPEIILGYKHSPALDMWSAGCCVYELFTGSPLFPGDDNNDMLWRFQSLRGHFPHRMIRYHVRACETLGIPAHFDGDLHFKRNVLDPVTRTPLTKLVDVTAPLEDLGAKLASHRSPDDDRRSLAGLRDLLEKMLVLDPAKRIGVREALAHPFIKGTTSGGASSSAAASGGGS